MDDFLATQPIEMLLLQTTTMILLLLLLYFCVLSAVRWYRRKRNALLPGSAFWCCESFCVAGSLLICFGVGSCWTQRQNERWNHLHGQQQEIANMYTIILILLLVSVVLWLCLLATQYRGTVSLHIASRNEKVHAYNNSSADAGAWLVSWEDLPW